MNNKLPQMLGFSLILDIIILDQISKWWVMEYILRPMVDGHPTGVLSWIMHAPDRVLSGISIAVLPSFNLTMVWNEGVSFGLFQGLGIWPLVTMAAVISLYLSVLLKKSTSKFESIGLGIIIGGAIGNIIDRLRFGAVADFFDVYIGQYHWPAFNIADSAICIGVAMLLWHGLFLDGRKQDKQKEE